MNNTQKDNLSDYSVQSTALIHSLHAVMMSVVVNIRLGLPVTQNHMHR